MDSFQRQLSKSTPSKLSNAGEFSSSCGSALTFLRGGAFGRSARLAGTAAPAWPPAHHTGRRHPESASHLWPGLPFRAPGPVPPAPPGWGAMANSTVSTFFRRRRSGSAAGCEAGSLIVCRSCTGAGGRLGRRLGGGRCISRLRRHDRLLNRGCRLNRGLHRLGRRLGRGAAHPRAAGCNQAVY